MSFPTIRMRRLRKNENIRRMLHKVTLSSNNLIYPIFVEEAISEPIEVSSMPGINRLPIEKLVSEIREVIDLGIKAVILFGLPSKKDEQGSSAYDSKGIVQNAVRIIKKEFGKELVVITDLCLCEYTTHGHCGIIKNGYLVNDETLNLLGKIAVSQAEAGADIVAPSGMIDGQVKTIRESLDKEGFIDTVIMAYSAKFLSSFYSPFREAVDSNPKYMNRSSYQMDYRNPIEALHEVDLDIEEGADVIIVKPALAYLDIIQRISSKIKIPLVAYNVSGEFALVKAASEKGWVNEKEIVIEILTAIKRAGADMIITYHAKDVAKWLNE
ncbi:MAG TPA: porphobilinogen synthase [Nitrososphaerales archaeon]